MINTNKLLFHLTVPLNFQILFHLLIIVYGDVVVYNTILDGRCKIHILISWHIVPIIVVCGHFCGC